MERVEVFSAAEVMFKDRQAAGRLMARELRGLNGPDTLVCGIPRGGMIVACEAAKVLEAVLDVVPARKLRSPENEELAFGAVSLEGASFIDEELVARLGIEDWYIKSEKSFEISEVERRTRAYRRIKRKETVDGKVVILTDDGLATGATMQAALMYLATEKPKELICAVPVGAPDTVERMSGYADRVFCLYAPPFFSAVGRFYEDFPEITDREVMAVLSGCRTG